MATPVLEIQDVAHAYGDAPVLKGVRLSLKRDAIACLLGPSGCGKTTLLRCIAGFEPVRAGQIRLSGKLVTEPGRVVPPERRRIGFVFQDFALFPHLTALDNIRFGLRDLDRSDADARVRELGEVLEITSELAKFPHELSGGQQQRVALARALAPRPELLLLDEPFSNLDPHLREKMKREMRRVLKSLNTTALIVTHDQYEAFDTADEIGVMKDGLLLQWDSAYSLYHEPASREVAEFIGEGAFIPGQVVASGRLKTELGEFDYAGTEKLGPVGTRVHVLLRPDDLVHDDESQVKGRIVERMFRGMFNLFHIALPSGAVVPSMAPSHHNHEIGSQVGVRLELDHVVVFPDRQ